jgi:hypothetical protein
MIYQMHYFKKRWIPGSQASHEATPGTASPTASAIAKGDGWRMRRGVNLQLINKIKELYNKAKQFNINTFLFYTKPNVIS